MVNQAKQDLQEFKVSNDLLGDLPQLKKRLYDEGYLFFREILDKDYLLRIKHDVLEVVNKHGMIKPGTNVMDGIYKGGDIPTASEFETSQIYSEILDLESFNSFSQHPVFQLLYSGLLDAEILEHRRRIGRVTFPKSFNNTTPAHQDYFFIRGTKETYTTWIPCGDCPIELGGLAILSGSNHLGFLDHVPMSGIGGNGIPESAYESASLQWMGTDFKVGDMLLFHSLTLHKALHNVTKDRLRVSMEYRFQRKGDDIDPGSLKLHDGREPNEVKD